LQKPLREKGAESRPLQLRRCSVLEGETRGQTPARLGKDFYGNQSPFEADVYQTTEGKDRTRETKKEKVKGAPLKFLFEMGTVTPVYKLPGAG